MGKGKKGSRIQPYQRFINLSRVAAEPGLEYHHWKRRMGFSSGLMRRENNDSTKPRATKARVCLYPLDFHGNGIHTEHPIGGGQSESDK